MRLLDRFISFIFSLLFLALAIVLILLGTGVIDPLMCQEILSKYVFDREMLSSGMFNPITIVGIVLLICSLKTTIFLSLFRINDRKPIVVKHKNGEVQIAQDTIINTAKTATLAFDNVRDVQAKMVKKRSGIIIYEVIQVYVNSNINELTESIQFSVKEVIKATVGVNVQDVNIRVRNVYSGKKPEPEKVEEEKKEVISETSLEKKEVEANNTSTVEPEEAHNQNASEEVNKESEQTEENNTSNPEE
jgi:uncharacterized alkaline shock family protein YloU